MRLQSRLKQEKNEENEKKQAFLLKLSDAIKELIDPVDIQLTACRILGEHVKVGVHQKVWSNYIFSFKYLN